jgi:hypothetical protein
MSTVFYNVVTVTGEPSAVDRLRCDARRALSGRLRKSIGPHVDWSFEKLFQLHPKLSDFCGEPPADEWHYLVRGVRVAPWRQWSRAQFRLEVKNYQLHEMLRPLSKYYRGSTTLFLSTRPREVSGVGRGYGVAGYFRATSVSAIVAIRHTRSPRWSTCCGWAAA